MLSKLGCGLQCFTVKQKLYKHTHDILLLSIFVVISNREINQRNANAPCNLLIANPQR